MVEYINDLEYKHDQSLCSGAQIKRMGRNHNVTHRTGVAETGHPWSKLLARLAKLMSSGLVRDSLASVNKVEGGQRRHWTLPSTYTHMCT